MYFLYSHCALKTHIFFHLKFLQIFLVIFLFVSSFAYTQISMLNNITKNRYPQGEEDSDV
ncbi:hypothetical protein BLX87_16010 [Bacillus sp. VT-16-64]|nr:hypothetical protein BLX87_16010 [Bacillus sp. VT-16-64]